jgi:hypothetical protein
MGTASITASSRDSLFDQPYVMMDETRTDPVPHRYLHGGFSGTDARFSLYFPTLDQYRGRFFQNTYPLMSSADIGPLPNGYAAGLGNLAFAIESGAYYVQTNLGGHSHDASDGDPTIVAYRVNAAAAKYSRTVAASLYGEHRPYGYLYGGSGGAYQVIGSAENTLGVWDGYVPFLMGTEHSIPSSFTVIQHTLRVLRRRDKVAGVIHAVKVGADPYAALDNEERAALREATLFGFPTSGWADSCAIAQDFFPNLAPFIPKLDPNYNEDFWTTPGYLGAEPSALVREARFQFDTEVVDVIDGFPARFLLAALPERDFGNAHLVLMQGALAGSSIPIRDHDGSSIGFALYADQSVINSVHAGDAVRIDNSWALAMETYHRHQVPDPSEGLYAWDQYRDAAGEPIYPQRERLIGPAIARRFSGLPISGAIDGKMLMLQGLADISLHPWQADWYRSRVAQSLGSDPRQAFALRFIENGGHDNPKHLCSNTEIITLNGHVEQALQDICGWVEKAVLPSETRYEVVDAQIVLPATAHERRGVQPVVRLTANGKARAEASIKETVSFSAEIEAPEVGGAIILVEWDFEGVGDFPAKDRTLWRGDRLRANSAHTYARPGSYLAAVRVTYQRREQIGSTHGLAQNIARVQVDID